MTSYETLDFTQDGPVTRIALNRPDAANSINDVLGRELMDAASRCDVAETKPRSTDVSAGRRVSE